MKLFDGYTDAEADPGLWFPWHRALKPGEEYDLEHPNPTGNFLTGAWQPGPKVELKDTPIAFRIRAIPDDMDERIIRRWQGTKVEQRFKKGATIINQHRGKNRAMNLERGIWCLRDSINATITPRDEGFREALASAVGAEVKMGEPVCVDKHWTDDLKKLAFNSKPDLLLFVLKRAGILAAESNEDEEGKEED